MRTFSTLGGRHGGNTLLKDQEAVIKFQFDHESVPACDPSDIAEMERWRRELRTRQFLGQHPDRYEGLGYGNLSARLRDGTVLITGSQTGCLDALTTAHYVRILEFDPEQNRVRSRGLGKPSSETLTHMAVYQSVSGARYVFHTHCPKLWRAAKRLKLPITDPDAKCGSPEIFYSVVELLRDQDLCSRGILSMGGHEDGILTWGETADDAGFALLRFL